MKENSTHHLTNNLADLVRKSPNVENEGVVQYLGIKEDDTKKSVALFSDGTVYFETSISEDLANDFKNKLEEFDIVKVGVGCVESARQSFFLKKFEVLGKNIESKIGNPVEYKIEDMAIKSKEETKSSEKVETEENKIETLCSPKTSSLCHDVSENNFFLETITKIEDLTSESVNFILRGKVEKKTVLKKFKAGEKDGSVFNAVISDGSSSIQVSFYHEAADEFYTLIEEEKVFAIFGGAIKPSGRFNMTKNPLSVSMEKGASIKELSNIIQIEKKLHNLVLFEEVKTKNENELVDIFGKIDNIGKISEFIRKDNSSTHKRIIELADDNENKVKVTLWGDLAVKFSHEISSLLLFTDLRVKTYQAHDLSSSISTLISDDPEKLTFAKNFLASKELSRNNNEVNSPNKITNVSQLLQIKPNDIDSYDNLSLVGHFSSSSPFVFHKGCEKAACGQKVEPFGDLFFCHSCEEVLDPFQTTPLIILSFSDVSGQIPLSFTDKNLVSAVFGRSVEDLKKQSEESPDEFDQEIKKNLQQKFKICLSVKNKSVDSQKQIVFDLISIEPTD